MSRPRVLTMEEVFERMKHLTGWNLVNGMLQKEFLFSTYLEGVKAINQIAHESEALDHHPLMELGYKRVLVKTCTHEPSGITDLDFELLERIEAVLEKSRPS